MRVMRVFLFFLLLIPSQTFSQERWLEERYNKSPDVLGAWILLQRKALNVQLLRGGDDYQDDEFGLLVMLIQIATGTNSTEYFHKAMLEILNSCDSGSVLKVLEYIEEQDEGYIVPHAFWLCGYMRMAYRLAFENETRRNPLQEDVMFFSYSLFSDSFLLRLRRICAFADARREWDGASFFRLHGARDVENVDYPAMCRVAMNSSVRRDASFEIYRDFVGSEATPEQIGQEWKSLLNASLRGDREYVDVFGISKEITPQLAYDAGYVYGASFPDQIMAQNATQEQIDAAAAACFNGSNEANRAFCIVAGSRHAQEDFK